MKETLLRLPMDKPFHVMVQSYLAKDTATKQCSLANPNSNEKKLAPMSLVAPNSRKAASSFASLATLKTQASLKFSNS